jgi:hypothetical protein
MNSFLKGVAAGAGIMLALVLVVAGFRFFYKRDQGIYEYLERQDEIREIKEDYGGRDPYEFLDDPGVRGAADSGIERIRRKRDEVLQRGGGGGNN